MDWPAGDDLAVKFARGTIVKVYLGPARLERIGRVAGRGPYFKKPAAILGGRKPGWWVCVGVGDSVHELHVSLVEPYALRPAATPPPPVALERVSVAPEFDPDLDGPWAG